MSGKFIVFEGVDGSGKTTQLKLLGEELRSRGYEVLCTREPGGTRVGESIRDILLNPAFNDLSPLAEAFLYAAARAQHVERVILPALEEGKIVLCDRFVDSSFAYQGSGRGLEIPLLKKINEPATSGLVPDLVLILDFSCGSGMDRICRSGRRIDRIEGEREDFHAKVRSGYIALAESSPSRYRLIDAGRPVGQVRRDVLKAVEEVLK
ncbi:MAG TPA: dTMP kinase [Bacillota bacterium]|nr:dTMP kinase [Bacillota bacterium]